jgi:CMP-N-acetylneuraminic acid synthetase
MPNIAIIPVRTGSKRLPNKNILDFFGKPMFMHTVDAALESELFDEVHVSTESELVANICLENNLPIKFLRPDALAGDTASLESVCLYTLNKFLTDYEQSFNNFCLLWATAPLRTSLDIVNSYGLLQKDCDCDCVVSVTDYDLPVYCSQQIDHAGFLKPNFPDLFWLPGQDMPKVYCDNGALSWCRVDAFKREGVWMPKKSKPYYMDKSVSADIDTQLDLDYARYLYSLKTKNKI